jgi:hypothetical protein
VIDEPAVFEEVLEEDLDFGAHGFEPEPQVGPVPDEASGAILMPADVATLPPIPPEDEGGVTGAFEPVPVLEPEPEPVFEPLPTPAVAPEPRPAFEAQATPAFEPEPEPVFERAGPCRPCFEPGAARGFVDQPSPVPEPAVAAPPPPSLRSRSPT